MWVYFICFKAHKHDQNNDNNSDKTKTRKAGGCIYIYTHTHLTHLALRAEPLVCRTETSGSLGHRNISLKMSLLGSFTEQILCNLLVCFSHWHIVKHSVVTKQELRLKKAVIHFLIHEKSSLFLNTHSLSGIVVNCSTCLSIAGQLGKVLSSSAHVLKRRRKWDI